MANVAVFEALTCEESFEAFLLNHMMKELHILGCVPAKSRKYFVEKSMSFFLYLMKYKKH